MMSGSYRTGRPNSLSCCSTSWRIFLYFFTVIFCGMTSFRKANVESSWITRATSLYSIECLVLLSNRAASASWAINSSAALAVNKTVSLETPVMSGQLLMMPCTLDTGKETRDLAFFLESLLMVTDEVVSQAPRMRMKLKGD